MSVEDYKPKFTLQKGDQAPDFNSINQDGKKISLSSIKTKWTVLIFYPEDMTPTCTKQVCNIRDNFDGLKTMDCTILGISPSSKKQHLQFIDKHNLPFDLVLDEDLTIAKLYKVWSIKKFMGVVYDGIHRSSFVLDEAKRLHKIIYPVVSGSHHEQIIAALTEAQ